MSGFHPHMKHQEQKDNDEPKMFLFRAIHFADYWKATQNEREILFFVFKVKQILYSTKSCLQHISVEFQIFARRIFPPVDFLICISSPSVHSVDLHFPLGWVHSPLALLWRVVQHVRFLALFFHLRNKFLSNIFPAFKQHRTESPSTIKLQTAAPRLPLLFARCLFSAVAAPYSCGAIFHCWIPPLRHGHFSKKNSLSMLLSISS